MNINIASFVTPPFRDSATTTVNTTVRLYTAVTTTQNNVLPDDWRGRYIEIGCEGGTVDYVLSVDSAQIIDRTVAATSAGASSSTLGGRLTAGEKVPVVVPDPAGGGQVYLARQADVSTAVLRITVVSP
jgi:hypothetical protein